MRQALGYQGIFGSWNTKVYYLLQMEAIKLLEAIMEAGRYVK